MLMRTFSIRTSAATAAKAMGLAFLVCAASLNVAGRGGIPVPQRQTTTAPTKDGDAQAATGGQARESSLRNPRSIKTGETPSGISPQAWSGILAQVQTDTYAVVAARQRPGVLAAANPAHRFVAEFSRDGVTIIPGQDALSRFTFGSRELSGGTRKPAVAAVVPVASEGRVEYHHPGYIEWYANSPQGLEQGWTLDAPRSSSGERRFEVEVRHGTALADGSDAILIQDSRGKTRYRYAGLKAWDAQQVALPARIFLTGRHRLVVAVDDRNARYPITLDPVLTLVPLTLVQSARVTASDGAAGDQFGGAVAADGDTLIVGAPGKFVGGISLGAAYVFSRNRGGANAWGQVAALGASDAAANDDFGISVAVHGDSVVVGDSRNASSLGAAYVYSRNQGGANKWGQVRKLTATGGRAGDRFGSRVAVNGDTVAVGTENVGLVYVFSRNLGGANLWGQVKALAFSSNNNTNASIALDGDTVVLGLPQADGKVFLSTGSALVFSRNQGGTDSWGQVATVGPLDETTVSGFGSSVAVDGDTVVVGSKGDGATHTAVGSGAAYVFSRNQGGANTWGQAARLTASDAAGTQFGYSVAVNGDTVVAGAAGPFDNGPNSSTGSVYVFSRNQGGAGAWGQVNKLAASGRVANDAFGQDVALDGDTVVVGESGPGSAPGAAYIFSISGGVSQQQAEPLPADAAAGDGLGRSIAVDGDTLLVGAYASGGANGAAYIFSRNQGGANTWGKVAKLTLADGMSRDFFGISVAMDNDTAVVGAYLKNNNAGAAYVFSRNQGGANTWGQAAQLIASDAASTGEFGIAVAVDGDTALVGSFGTPAAFGGAGAAYVFSRNQGGANSWGQAAKLGASDTMSSDQFGYAVALHGDTAAIGAYGNGGNVGGPGAAYVFSRNQGGANTWGQAARLAPSDGASGDTFGLSITVHGDTVIVGAPQKNGNTGAAYVFSRNQGGANSWGQVAELTAADAVQGDKFGTSVAVTGDTAVVGAPLKNGGAGAAYVYSRNQGGAGAWGQINALAAADAAVPDQFGFSVAVNGDTVVSGAQSRNNSTGAAYVFSLVANLPTVAVDTRSLSFPAQAVGTTSPAQTVTVSNHGSAPLNVSGLVLGGANSGDFAATGCTSAVAVGASCSVQVTFAPTATAARGATLAIGSPIGPTLIALAGTGSGQPPPAPVVTISVNPTAINLGQSATLTWSSTDATACTASGAWSGSSPTAGTASQTPAAAGTSTYTLTCTGAGGSDSKSAVLTVNAGPPSPVPTVTIAVNPASITLGSSATLSWSSTNATDCSASGAWSGTRAVSGTLQQTPTAVGDSTYTLNCTGPGGSGNGSAVLTANAVGQDKTISTPRGDVVIHTSAGSLTNVMLVATPANAPHGFSYPLGFFGYSITGLTPGATVTVTMTVPADILPTLYMLCQGTTCAGLPNASIQGNVLTLTFTDGGAGDADGIANGTVVDPGAPALANPPSGDSGGGAMGGPVLAMLGLVALLRRRSWRLQHGTGNA